MCGIYGDVFGSPESRSRFAERARIALNHRGPDAHARWEDANALIGHTRLKIIDLSERGAQPMVARSATSVMAYNGEAYNYVELRQRLPSFPWRSTSDTEVLLELLDRDGLEGLEHVVGMFAIALYRPRERVLWLIRDRLGKKPLYYRPQRDGLQFASEIPPLLTERPRARREHLAEFVQFGFVSAPRTAFEDVLSVPAGHALRAELVDGRLRTSLRRYWQLPEYEEPPAHAEAAWLEEFRSTLEDAVRVRLQSDVPVAAFLSGGVDSSVVCMLAAKHTTRLATYTVDFEDAAFSERSYAAEVAETVGVENHVIPLPALSTDVINEVVQCYADPFGDISAVPTMAVCRAMKERATVVLSGDGGDELLAGYTRYRLALTNSTSRVDRGLRTLLEERFPVWMRGDSRLAVRGARSVNDAFRAMMAMYPLHQVPPLFAGDVTVHDPYAESLNNHRRRPDLLRMMAADAEVYLPGDNLTKVDRASMHVGLEVRSPFLDHRLFEMIARARPDWLLSADGSKTPLRKSYAHALPKNVFSRAKMGFSVPVRAWIDDERLQARLVASDSPLRGVLDMGAVRRLVQTYPRVHEHAARIWQLLLLDRWLRVYQPTIV